jgi:hypothetical protein
MLVAVLESFGRQLDPDLVVYGWMPNDQCLPSFLVPEPSTWSWTSFTRLYLERGVPTLSLLSSREAVADAGAGAASGGAIDEEHCFPGDVPAGLRDRVGPDVLARGLERLARFARDEDVPVVVMKYNHDRLGGLPAELPPGLELVDLQPRHDRAFLAGPNPGLESELFLSPQDTHPSPKAHRLLARGLLAELERRRIVERVLGR